MSECEKCDGLGSIQVLQGKGQQLVDMTCPDCDGSGEVEIDD